jgi:hypothetical protein
MHESARGWRLDKLKQQHKIDPVVALSMASLGAIRGVGQYAYDTTLDFVHGSDDESAEADAARSFQEQRFNQHVLYHGGYYLQRRW